MSVSHQHDKIHADIYDRVNRLESEIDKTNGYLKGVVESNEKLIALLTKSQSHLKHALMLGWIFAFMCLGALIYGAIGKDGLYSVRKTMPVPATSDAVPAHNDFDKWRNGARKGAS